MEYGREHSQRQVNHYEYTNTIGILSRVGTFFIEGKHKISPSFWKPRAQYVDKPSRLSKEDVYFQSSATGRGLKGVPQVA